MNSSFLIGASSSNSGKTTLTMGLMRALRDSGFGVQPFKCGPDYIDTMFHSIASGNQSVNLDTFMSSKEHVREMFLKYGTQADVRIVEGVMGLMDGYDRYMGSSAELSALLDIPVVLVMNAKSMAYSVAPVLYGFKNYRFGKNQEHSIRLSGVIFNMVGSKRHYNLLKDAALDAGVPCLGYMQKKPELVIPGRHLGLTISEKAHMEELIQLSAEEVSKHVDLDRLLELTSKNGL